MSIMKINYNEMLRFENLENVININVNKNKLQ